MDIGIDLKGHKQKTRRLDREDANSPNLKRINLALQGGGSAWRSYRRRRSRAGRRSMQASSFSCGAGNKTAPRAVSFLFPLCGTSVRGRIS
jgi:hypothetical protein